MRTLHEAIGAVESYSPAEEAFNRRRRTWGFLLAPLIFLAMWAALFAAWGLLALRPSRLIACIIAVGLGAASAGFSVLWLSGGWWPWGIGCTIGGSIAIVVGLWRARRLLKRRA